MLDIGSNQLTAKSEAALSPGQVLRLQVMQTSPQVELKIVTDTLSIFSGKSLTLLGKNIDIGALFQALQNQTPSGLTQLTPVTRNVVDSFFTLQQSSFSGREGGQMLKQLVEGLGLNLENLLARGDQRGAVQTLKAALMEMAHTFVGAEKIADMSNRMLTTIELFQLAQLHAGDDKFLIFPLPLPFIEQGYLIIEKDNGEGGDVGKKASEDRFSLHLTMSDLGNLLVDFFQNNEGLFIRFYAENQEIADFIGSFADELREAITDVPLINIAFSADAPDPINDLMQKLIPAGEPLVDTKA